MPRHLVWVLGSITLLWLPWLSGCAGSRSGGASFVPGAEGIRLPSAWRTDRLQASPGTVAIELDATGLVEVARCKLGRRPGPDFFRRRAPDVLGREIVIAADARVSTEDFVALLDQCALLGRPRIALKVLSADGEQAHLIYNYSTGRVGNSRRVELRSDDILISGNTRTTVGAFAADLVANHLSGADIGGAVLAELEDAPGGDVLTDVVVDVQCHQTASYADIIRLSDCMRRHGITWRLLRGGPK